MAREYFYISVDNEDAPHEIIDTMFSAYPNYKRKTLFYNPVKAIEYLKTNTCDLMFTDVEMPEMDGFQMLEQIQNPPLTVILTGYPVAYSEKAFEYFDMGIFDFLSKAFIPRRFKQTLDRFEKLSEDITMLNKLNNFQTLDPHFFPITDSSIVKHVPMTEICCFEVDKNYVYILTVDGKIYTIRDTLQDVMQKLPSNTWIQISRDVIIIVDNILSFNAYSVNMGYRNDGTEIILPIATRKRREVVDYLNFRKTALDNLITR
jgi:two-component system, LytTR family, response regulator